MSTLTATWELARSRRDEATERWQSASPAARTRIQLVVLLSSVLIAYHYSLSSLLQTLNADTPLAYLGLVPLIALVLAASQHRPRRREPAIYDRQLDYILGLPLVVGALLINMIVPDHIASLFWIWRLDLLTLPVFVAGAVMLLFGARTLWRQKVAVLYLALAWPLPYSILLVRVLNDFTNLTLAALQKAIHIIPVAKVVPGTGGSIFAITHHGHQFPLSVVSACSGVNGVVGFVLVGSAFAALVRGPLVRKTLWILAGMVLLWAINLARILFIFWTGKVWGEGVAINILHPFIGLVTFNIGVLVMLLVAPRLGLQIGWSSTAAKQGIPAGSGRLAVPHIFGAAAVVVVLALLLGITDANLKTYNFVANAAGEPKLASYSDFPASPAGWQAQFIAQYTWAKDYFGSNSTWYRYIYQPLPSGGNLHASLPIYADVINTTSLSSFSAYGITACYRFHGYRLRDVAQVNLGHGIRGQALSYETGVQGDWSILYWIWPVNSPGATHYERIVLYLQDSTATTVSAPHVSGIQSLQGALNPAKQTDQRLINERDFLTAFGRQVVLGQSAVKPGTVMAGLMAAVNPEAPGNNTLGPATSTPSHPTTSPAEAVVRAERLGRVTKAEVARAQAHAHAPARAEALAKSKRQP